MADIIDVAIKNIGVSEKDSGHMKFINWYGGFGRGAAWCAIFVSYCANKAGVSTSIVPKYSKCSVGKDWFVKKGLFKQKGNYTPKRGDIVFFLNNRSHTGIVEKVSGNTLHTIEGNTSDKVARRTYSLSNKAITGYGTPKYKNSRSKNSSVSVGKELDQLKNIINKRKNKSKVEDYIGNVIYNHANIKVKLVVEGAKGKFEVPVLEDMKVTLERVASPGKLTFKTIFDKRFKIQEGNNVKLYIDGKRFFVGIIFSKNKESDQFISFTAYDQLRYLKNKITYTYKNKSADQIITNLAKMYGLNVGKIEKVGYKTSRIEEDTELFDVVQNILDETMTAKNAIYTFYDDGGKLTLKNMKNMSVHILIDEETAEGYSYSSSIDEQTYNYIILLHQDDETGKVTTFIEKDKKNIAGWGTLQYYEKIDNKKIGKEKAKVLLEMYNKKTKSLSIKGAMGHLAVKAGTLLPVLLDLGDMKVKNYMLVEKVTHTFRNKEHKMDLTLHGGDFNG